VKYNLRFVVGSLAIKPFLQKDQMAAAACILKSAYLSCRFQGQALRPLMGSLCPLELVRALQRFSTIKPGPDLSRMRLPCMAVICILCPSRVLHWENCLLSSLLIGWRSARATGGPSVLVPTGPTTELLLSPQPNWRWRVLSSGLCNVV
jgi:hypothetical protein